MPRSRLLHLLTFLVFLSASGIYAQTQASCTFKLFPLNVSVPNIGTLFLVPAGVNDYGTIVGAASLPTAIDVAFVRWANGGITLPLGTSESSLADRNDHGTSIDYMGPESGQTPILLNGTMATPIQFVPSNGGGPFNVFSINNWGSIVGFGVVLDLNTHGFKRWSNGSFLTLDFPGAVNTLPSSINDSGAVVGDYSDASGVSHGFMYLNAKWATLDYPNASQTFLGGISNSGEIVGNATVNGAATAFLYVNGTFKVISVPNSPPNSTGVAEISPKIGLIAGTNLGTSQGFVGTCH
jgi:hypothetical protein